MRIVVKAEIPARVRAILAKVRDLSGLTAYCSNLVARQVRDHLGREAAVRHSWARRLGAEPTGFLEDAAASVVAAPEPRAVVVRVDSPGVVRAYRAVDIRPRNGSTHLTVPVHRLAYGRRASSLVRAVGARLFRVESKRGNKLLATRDPADGSLVPLYALKLAVRQDRDPSLMPSDVEIAGTIAAGTKEYIRRHIAAAGGRRSA